MGKNQRSKKTCFSTPFLSIFYRFGLRNEAEIELFSLLFRKHRFCKNHCFPYRKFIFLRVRPFKQRPKIDAKKDVVLAPSWLKFCLPFGSLFALFSLPDRSLTMIFCKRRRLNEIIFSCRKTYIFAFRGSPQTTQDRPQTTPRGNFFALKFRPRFVIDFGTILPPKMPPFWHPFRSQNRSRKKSKIRC